MFLQFAQKALIVKGDRVLLVRKATDDPHNPGRWELPGGRLKQNESLDAALQREVMEEVGLAVVPGRPLAIWSWRLGDGPEAPTVVAVARLCNVEEAEVSFDGHEADDYIDGYEWFAKSEVLEQDLIPSARKPIEQSLRQL
ncbi:NUDIX hydrolase [Micromonospora sp. NPDC047793]|uniref:NUDIX hydrolase n=1 Tax=Micromonospora sp. NPDC047793 TaxID=3154342 RepID=UPI003405FE52